MFRTITGGSLAILIASCTPPALKPTPVATAVPDQSLSIGGLPFGPGDVQSTEAGFDSQQLPVVNLVFTPKGAAKFQRAMLRTGVGHPMPIVVGGKELSAPILREMLIKDRVSIAGSFTSEEAKSIAAAIAAAVNHDR